MQILARWRCPVALSEAMVSLHRAIHLALYWRISLSEVHLIGVGNLAINLIVANYIVILSLN
jgi:hypothetical protein